MKVILATTSRAVGGTPLDVLEVESHNTKFPPDG